jgi:hypothetical protein
MASTKPIVVGTTPDQERMVRDAVSPFLATGETYEHFLETHRPILERGVAGLAEMLFPED